MTSIAMLLILTFMAENYSFNGISIQVQIIN